MLSLKSFIFSFFVESFTRKQEYGLTLLVSTDDKVNQFINNVLSQIEVSFLTAGSRPSLKLSDENPSSLGDCREGGYFDVT